MYFIPAMAKLADFLSAISIHIHHPVFIVMILQKSF